MKLLIAISICALISHAFGATIDVYDGTTYNIDEARTKTSTITVSDIEDAFEFDETSLTEIEARDTIRQVRTRRFTCDVLSFKSKWLSPNHSACAVRCLAQRRRGGHCKSGICICRGKKWGK